MSLNYNDILEDESPKFTYSIPPKDQPHPKNWFGNTRILIMKLVFLLKENKLEVTKRFFTIHLMQTKTAGYKKHGQKTGHSFENSI